MEPKMYVMTHAVMCGAIAENEKMTIEDRLHWIEGHIRELTEPHEADQFAEALIIRMNKLKRLRVG